MQPDKLIIGFLIFAAFIFGGIFIMYGDVNDPDAGILQAYDVPKDSLGSKLENLTKTEKVGQEVQNLTSQQKTDTSDEFDTTAQWRVIDIGPVKAIRRMYSYFTSMNTLIAELALSFHVPKFIVDNIWFIILVAVTFMVIYFVMRFQLRND